MGSDRARSRCRDRLLAACQANLDHETLRLELLEQLRTTIGFATWGWPLADPDTLLATTGIADPAAWPLVPRSVADEEHTTDLNQDRELASGNNPIRTLSAATRGDLVASRRWREIYHGFGLGDELRAACVDRYGCWAHLRLLRSSSDPPFDPADVAMLRTVLPTISLALRRQIVRPAPDVELEPLEPGIVILDNQLAVRGWTPTAETWFGVSVGTQRPTKHNMHCAVIATAARCQAAEHNTPGPPARARLRLGDGRWIIVEAAPLHGGTPGVAVTIRPASNNEILDLLARAHALTPRERELVGLLTQGLDTRALTRRLHISPHTVQQHLKSIFDKLGVRSRRELLTGVFAADNETD
jgi:DNA-binding CsgD family transcriptional regulator